MKKTIFIGVFLIGAVGTGLYFGFRRWNREPKSPYTNVLPSMIAEQRKNTQNSPLANAYQLGNVDFLLKNMNEGLSNGADEFFHYSIRYFDMNESLGFDSQHMIKFIEGIFKFISDHDQKFKVKKERTLAVPFLKRLRGRGHDDLISNGLLKLIKNRKPQEIIYLDALDVLVGISPFNPELLQQCLSSISKNKNNEAYPIVQLLSELSDEKALRAYLETLSKTFGKAPSSIKPIYYKILVERGTPLNINLQEPLTWIKQQKDEVSMDVLLTTIPLMKDPRPYQSIVSDLASSGGNQFLKARAAQLLKQSPLWRARQ